MNVGDWSLDGHEHNVEVDFTSSHPANELKDAYKESVRLTGVTFNHTETWGAVDPVEVCTEYEESTLSHKAIGILEEFGFDFGDEDDKYDFGYKSEEFAKLILWFIGLSLENFEYEIVVHPRKTYLNGLWDKDLNEAFGYGLFC